MDFEDTKDEAAFRAEANKWLSANAKLRGRKTSKDDLEEMEHRIRGNGMYPHRMDDGELARVAGLAEDEKEAWFADVMRDNGRTMSDLYRQRIAQRDTMSALDDMKQYEQITQANADGTKRLVEAFEPLYASLSPEQKKLADANFRGEHSKARHSRTHGRTHAAGADAASATKP